MLTDQYDRIASYLRIGVTDRCNLRCRYCMPEEGIDFASRKDILTYEEITRLCKIFKELGVSKVRLTGGEPFVRNDIESLLRQLTDIFPSVHITTNATLLHDHVDLLRDINISGLNISLDSLDRNRFAMITRRDQFNLVMQNIELCRSHHIPIKINCVVMQGINEMEILEFVNYAIRYDTEVRFIEAMPFNDYDGNKNVFLSAGNIFNIIKEKYPQIKEVYNGSSASLKYEIGNQQVIGIIPAYTRSLCGMCNRIRMTPRGEFLTCLYASSGLDLLSLVRNSQYSDDDISVAIKNAVSNKKASGIDEEEKRENEVFRSMTTIGG